ncbi:MAG: cytosolic factor, phosphatidylinositol/phosphatidylcholine transfer protein [Vezdaea aestivalis]|nr:MAG: cytosolic factor, phosphatidylinositol/phosphatidylcholine transfer protein [Vezdaea aestivalis]
MATTAKVEGTGPKFDEKYDDFDFPIISPVAKPGHPGHTTPEEDAKVHQLRAMLEQEGYTERLDTLSLLRFLRARKFEVQLSKAMFIECEKWRKEFEVENLIRNFTYDEKAKVMAYYPQYYHKTDKDGRPVYIEQLGKVNLTAMREFTTDERMLQNLVIEYEKVSDPRLPACSRKAGQLLETCCSILDMKGVGLGRAWSVLGYVKKASAISQNYYPERLGRMYVINSPWGFPAVWNAVKGYLDPVTVEKVHFLGNSYKAELLKQVPAENLPVEFGGTCKCDGGCQMSDMGPWHDPQWAKDPRWKQKDAAAAGTITKPPGMDETSAGKEPATGTAVPEAKPAVSAAPVPQSGDAVQVPVIGSNPAPAS